jgi:hypothetical protein
MILAAELAQVTDDERHEPVVMLRAGSGGTSNPARSRRLRPVRLLRGLFRRLRRVLAGMGRLSRRDAAGAGGRA